jgi:hypothetical protein
MPCVLKKKEVKKDYPPLSAVENAECASSFLCTFAVNNHYRCRCRETKQAFMRKPYVDASYAQRWCDITRFDGDRSGGVTESQSCAETTSQRSRIPTGHIVFSSLGLTKCRSGTSARIGYTRYSVYICRYSHSRSCGGFQSLVFPLTSTGPNKTKKLKFPSHVSFKEKN